MTSNPLQPVVDRLEGQVSHAADLFIELATSLAEADVRALVSGVLKAVRHMTEARFAGFLGAGEAQAMWITEDGGDAFTDPPDACRAPLLAGSLAHTDGLLIDDLTRWAHSDDALRPYGRLREGGLIRSWLAVPVHRRSGRRYGTIFVGDPSPRFFTARQESLVKGVASLLASALEKDELLSERTRVVQALQESLLPPLLPSIPGLEVAARYHATGAGNLVGGDFYDVFELGGPTWAAVLGDVSGFGPEAAAITGIARYTVRAVAGTEPGPSAVLDALNRAICAQGPSERFCTAVYCRLTPGDDGTQLLLSLGGHPPPLVVRDNGHVEAVDLDPGLPLGLFEDADLTEGVVHLSPGDVIVLYTDGVIEGRSPSGEQFGDDRLRELLASSAGRTADGIARRVGLSVIDFQNGQIHDDVAVVAIRALGRA